MTKTIFQNIGIIVLLILAILAMAKLFQWCWNDVIVYQGLAKISYLQALELLFIFGALFGTKYNHNRRNQ